MQGLRKETYVAVIGGEITGTAIAREGSCVELMPHVGGLLCTIEHSQCGAVRGLGNYFVDFSNGTAKQCIREFQKTEAIF